jgi:polysaccharide biosynthesis protein PslG
VTRTPRAWTMTLLAAVVASMAFASAAQAVPANFWGIVPQTTPSADQFQRLKRGGVDSTRIPIFWGSVEPVKGGALNWSSVDPLVAGAATAGIDVLPFLYGAPSWVVANIAVPGSGGSVKAPKFLPVKTGAQRAAWSAFLSQAVARYGPNGTFWLENPALPPRPIRTWQIWNEANFKYFVVRPNPVEFGQLVNISYAALRSADPGAKIVLGGLFTEPFEATLKRKPPQAYFATDFLNRMYRSTPGIKPKFIGIGLHPYTGKYQDLTGDIEEAREVLKVNHDAGKAIWITELSWSSQRPRPNNSFAKGVSGQKKQLQGAFGLLKRNQAKWRIKRVYWFSVDDVPGACNFCDGSGLFGAGFVPKPSWFAYVKFAGGIPN